MNLKERFEAHTKHLKLPIYVFNQTFFKKEYPEISPVPADKEYWWDHEVKIKIKIDNSLTSNEVRVIEEKTKDG